MRRHGNTLIYMSIMMTMMFLFASLAVDYGRAQLAKTELRRAADAAARYGAQGFASNTVTANAIAAASQNTVDGVAVTLQNSDITTGYWNNGLFNTTGSGTSAVRVIARRTVARGNAIPLLWTRMFGRNSVDITVRSIATYKPNVNVTLNVQAKGDPWLAGMPSGTTANGYDSAPSNSPLQVSGITMVPGASLQFDFSGSASYLPGKGSFGPDGNLGRMIYNGWYTSFASGREHGMSNLTAPITSVVGVFLDNTQPDKAGALPPDLDFGDDADRDFASLSPKLRQPFFIGDGMRNDGSTPQNFVVPAGATRLFIGIMDGQQWSDNNGTFNMSVVQPGTIALVQ